MFLVVGGDSEIGASVVAHLRHLHRPVLMTTRRRDNVDEARISLDLGGDLSDWKPPPGVAAACICAGVARLADCATDPEGSARVNVTGTLTLTERLSAHGIYAVFLSTNQVFDGRMPHTPAYAPTEPVSEYGKQKARTEAALRAHMRQGAPAAILRLARVVSPRTVLLRDWVAALAAGKSIRAFHDVSMAPVPMDAVSRAIEVLMGDRAPGIFQLSGPRNVAYDEVGRFVAERLGADPALVVRTSAIAAGLPPGIAPAHTTLDSSAMRERYNIVVPDAWEVLDEVLNAMQTN